MTGIANDSELRCFICNAETPLEEDRINLLNRVPHGKLLSIEDNLVIIKDDSVICERCVSAINRLERVENERSSLVTELVGCINSKYKLGISAECSDLIQVKAKVSKEKKKELIKKDTEDEIAKPDVIKPVPEVPPKVPKINGTLGHKRTLQTPKAKPQVAMKIRIYECDFCSFRSKELNVVRLHMKGCNVDGEKATTSEVFMCVVCEQEFTDRGKCLEHIRKLHLKFRAYKSKVNDKKPESKPYAPVTNDVNQVADLNNSMPELLVLEPKKEVTEVKKGDELLEIQEDKKSEMEIDEIIEMNNNSEPEPEQKIENDEETKLQVDENSRKEENVNSLETDVNMETEEGKVDTNLLFGCDVCDASFIRADFIDHAKQHVRVIEERMNVFVMIDGSKIEYMSQDLPGVTVRIIGDGNVSPLGIHPQFIPSSHCNVLIGTTDEDTTDG